MFDAVYAPLTGKPVSDQGRAVVTRLVEAITAHERTAGLRKYERGKTSKQFAKAVGAFAAAQAAAQLRALLRGAAQLSFSANPP